MLDKASSINAILLANKDNIVINVADKNLGFCINTTKW